MKVKLTVVISYVNVFLGEIVCATYIMVNQKSPHRWRTVTFTFRNVLCPIGRRREGDRETENF